jgi:hypothetical protein
MVEDLDREVEMEENYTFFKETKNGKTAEIDGFC